MAIYKTTSGDYKRMPEPPLDEPYEEVEYCHVCGAEKEWEEWETDTRGEGRMECTNPLCGLEPSFEDPDEDPRP
jgi:hypothetical protein